MRLVKSLGWLLGSLLSVTACGSDDDSGGGSGASSGLAGAGNVGGSGGSGASGGTGATAGSGGTGGGSASGGSAGFATGGSAGSGGVGGAMGGSGGANTGGSVATGGTSGTGAVGTGGSAATGGAGTGGTGAIGGTGGTVATGGTGAIGGTGGTVSTGGTGGVVASGGTGGGTGSGYSLRFFGNGGWFDDRVLIRLDDPATTTAGPPVDVGATDFTIEFWMKATAANNPNPAINCGENINWIMGNIIVDRDIIGQWPKFGLSIGNGRLAWGVTGPVGFSRTICGTANVLANQWVHVAVQRKRSDGTMWILVGGTVDARAVGPAGDVSYPDNTIPMSGCPGGPCTYSDPFLSIGAEKHGFGAISYSGFVDELRISTTLRYGQPNVGQSYTVPTAPFSNDSNTVGLYHMDDGSGNVVSDSSGPGGVDGIRKFGGSPAGPVWTNDSPF